MQRKDTRRPLNYIILTMIRNNTIKTKRDIFFLKKVVMEPSNGAS